jgi:excisionase family DNA binding protein
MSDFLSVKDAMARLGISKPTLYKVLRDFEVKTLEVRRRRLIPADEYSALVKKLMAKAAKLPVGLNSRLLVEKLTRTKLPPVSAI